MEKYGFTGNLHNDVTVQRSIYPGVARERTIERSVFAGHLNVIQSGAAGHRLYFRPLIKMIEFLFFSLKTHKLK